MQKFDTSKIKDPTFFSDNRLKAHSDHIAYASWEEAERAKEDKAFAGGAAGSSFRISLDGVWKFHYAKNLDQVIPGFESTEYNCKSWDDIRVPAHIQMEGYDVPQYANVQYPWDGREEIWTDEIPTEFNPTACYVKYFTLPENFSNQKVFVSFQGVESGIALFLNGHYVGYSEDTFTPSEFELTPYLVEGENKLAAMVFKWTSSSWCEDQDFFRFSGIFRSVYLYTVPKVHLYDVKVEPEVTEALDAADLKIGLISTAKGKARFTLLDGENQVMEEERELDLENSFSFAIASPKLWSAEIPYLYELRIEVSDEAGILQEVTSMHVGFRRFEMKDGIMLINGKRIVFKGVNRHEFSSVTGRAVSRKELILDIETMKRNNINAIRTCHYPDDSAIYQLCDEYGLYLIAENNLESHGSWDPVLRGEADNTTVVPGDNMDWLGMMLDRVNSCYQRDKNHPSILIWSCGNESFGGKVLLEMSKEFHKLDTNRLVHYEGVFNDRRYDETSDMESQMYPSVERIKKYLAENKEKPFICCEYTHAMGNSCGAMHKYTDLTDTEPRYQGGFIWDYIDQSIYKKDRYGKEFQAYGGDFGERPTDYNFSGNGICYGGERKESPKMQEVKYNYQNISVEITEDTITVVNKNLFLNTDNYRCIAILEREGHEIQRKELAVSVNPLETKTFEMPFEVKKDAEYSVTVSFVTKEDTRWAKAGHEVAFGQNIFEKLPVLEGEKKPFTVIHGKLNIGVKGENFDVLFSKLNGGLVSYRYAGKEMIEKIPMPNFWRAPIDNDMGSSAPARYAQWKIASLYATHKSVGSFKEVPIGVKEEEDKVTVMFTYYLPTTPSSECEVAYTVYGDGTIATTLRYNPVKELGDMPEFGMMLKLNADYNQVEWYGLGESETYADRKHGAKLGIYANRVEDNMAKYLVPQECGNKEEVRWAKVTDRKGRGLLFTGDAMCFSALPYTPHEMENAMHDYELPQVHYTVIRVAKAQMGVGGDDSWGALVHPEYHIDITKKLEFTFTFKGI